jgi:hypothetical protein
MAVDYPLLAGITLGLLGAFLVGFSGPITRVAVRMSGHTLFGPSTQGHPLVSTSTEIPHPVLWRIGWALILLGYLSQLFSALGLKTF